MLPAIVLALAAVGDANAWVHAEAATGADSPVIFKFVTVGDSRQEPNRPGNTAQDERWLQSTAVWSRMLYEIEQLKPQALVFNGDMIYGYSSDAAVIDRQYAFWRGMVAGLMERGTYVLPVPGNHEVQVPVDKPGGGKIKRAQVAQENAWRANMGDLILNEPLWRKTTGTSPSAWDIGNSPAIGADGISTEQRQLSYSFDSGTIHIAVINTDPVGFDESAPATWLESDLAAAKMRGAKSYFVFGHKPAFTYFPKTQTGAQVKQTKNKNPEDGFASRRAVRDRFWEVIESFGATYFCGHQHVYHASQPRKDAGGQAWQIIVGTAGSPLTIYPGTPTAMLDAVYAFAEVIVRADGRVDVMVRGFDTDNGKTVVLEKLTIGTRN